MTGVILLTARLQQLFCNILKGFLILHFRLSPSRRYRLPNHAPPLTHRRPGAVVPPILWQTNYSGDVTLSLYVNYWWNRLMVPGYEYRFFDDDACAIYVRTHFPEAWEWYRRLQVGAARADYWRVLAILREGGLYLDLDATLCWNPDHFLRRGETELLLRMPDGSLTNYCFAAISSHPLLKEIDLRIRENIELARHHSVFDLTGPTVFQELGDREGYSIVSSRLVSRQGQLTNKSLQYPHSRGRFWVEEQKTKKILGD
ncbi:MAG: glycosyltransferase family 32 protein [Desulfuromonadia bacterium]